MTNFEVFNNVVIHCLECLIYLSFQSQSSDIGSDMRQSLCLWENVQYVQLTVVNKHDARHVGTARDYKPASSPVIHFHKCVVKRDPVV